MNFIDHTGHIFTLPSYKTYPSGYEYDEQPYIFWINDTGKLSVNNYYIKPIRFIFSGKYDIETLHLNIKLTSQYFNLLGSYHINNLINNSKNIFDYIGIEYNNKYWDGNDFTTISDEQKPNYVKFSLLKQELIEDDVICLTNLVTDEGDIFSMVTFYIVGYSNEEQVMLSNVLITLDNNGNKEYCPITIGGEFIDECEPLIINGKNLGINLPKTITRAFFDTSFYNYNVDEVIYNNKIKELLLNYIGIKGECGNYDSAIKALKWFGWGDKIKLSKLLQTDNEFITQYIVDKFEISNDTLKSFQYFTNTTFIKLQIIGSTESDEFNTQNISVLNSEYGYYSDNDDESCFEWNSTESTRQELNDIYDTFVGEGNPKIVNLIDNVSEVTYDDGDIKFYKPYYTYLFQELGLKLAALEYFYRKYFLPIHLFIHSSSISYQCFMNPNKMIVGERKVAITAPNVIGYDVNSKISVTFPKDNFLMFYTQPHIIDSQFNEFTKYILKPNEYLIYWNGTISSIYWNTEFIANNDIFNKYNLFWVNENCLNIPITFRQNTNIEDEYYNCKLILEKVDKVLYDYEYIFETTPITHYEYLVNTNKFNLISYDDANVMSCVDEDGNLINNDILISHQLFTQEWYTQSLVLSNEWDTYRTYSQFKEYIKTTYYNYLLFGQKLPKLNIKIKSPKRIVKLLFGSNNYIKSVKCNVLDDVHTLIYESSFSFIQHKTFNKETNKYEYDVDTLYRNFVIIPKIINEKYNVNFWLNNEFNLYLNVNGQWFNYNFNCKVPEFQMDLGKLEYKYYLDTTESYIAQHGDATLFKQLNKLTDDEVKFNMFMWEPDSVRVNNIDFFNNLLDYYKNYVYNIAYENNSLIFNDNENKIKLNDIYYTIVINNKKLYIQQAVIQEYLINQKHKYIQLYVKSFADYIFDTLMIYSTELSNIQYYSIYNEEYNETTDVNVDPDKYPGSSGSMNIEEGYENFLFTGEDSKTYSFISLNNNKGLQTNILEDDVNNYIFVYEDEYKNEGDDRYILLYFELREDNTIHFYVKDIYENIIYLETYKSFYKNESELYTKYVETPNIVNNTKYLNKVHQYFIYKDNNEELKYNQYNKKEAIELYNKFFNKDEQLTSKINIPDCEDIYDFYLMHDNEYWYVMFITRLPINKYPQNMLQITDARKEIIYTDYIDKIYSSKILEGNTVVYDYYNINAEILSNVLAKTGLIEDDLLIVYNTIDNLFNNDTSDYDNISNETHILTDAIKNDLTHQSHKYIINKIYNKNIGKFITNEYSNDETDILWNEEPNDNINYIGVNWTSIPVENVICPKCGHSQYFTNISHEVDENGIIYNTAYCTYITGKDNEGNPIECNYRIKLNTNSILKWNDKLIPFKLIYSITDDIYNEETNPEGLYHQEVAYTYDKYSFSMNNEHYYLIYNEDTNSYLLNGIDNDINKYEISYAIDNGIEFNKKTNIAIEYNDVSYSYIGSFITEESGYVTNVYTPIEFTYQYTYSAPYTYHYTYIKNSKQYDYSYSYAYYEIVNGLKYDILYYTYLNDIIIYSKQTFIEEDNTLNEFYILYDGNNIYNDAWNLVINKSCETSNISDVINIYSILDNSKLQWAVNPNYNYKNYNPETNEGLYVYKIGDDNNIKYYNKLDPNEFNNYIDTNKFVYIQFNCITNNNSIYACASLIGDNEQNVNVELTLDTIGMYIYKTDIKLFEKIELYAWQYSDYNPDVFILLGDVFWNIGPINSLLNGAFDINEHCYIINNIDYIQFNNNKPVTPIYIDENKQFFCLKWKMREDNNYEFYKQIIKREQINNSVIKEQSESTVFDTYKKIYYSTDYYEIRNGRKQFVIHHNKDWWEDNKVRLRLEDTEYNKDYDNLWYLISFDADICSPNKLNWQIVVYISEPTTESIELWYYKLNGIEYEFYPQYLDKSTGMIINSILPNDYKHKDANNCIHINLNNYLNNSIKVDLTRIPGTDYEEIYYDKIDYYYFKYVKSDNKFLINRMQFVSNNGKNHYNTDDIIVSSISSAMTKNGGLPFNVEFKFDYGSNWLFKPLSLAMNKNAEVKSNTKMAIMSIGDSNIRYERGYYDLIVNYSIDGNTQNIYEMKSRILVK